MDFQNTSKQFVMALVLSFIAGFGILSIIAPPKSAEAIPTIKRTILIENPSLETKMPYLESNQTR